MVEQQTDQSTSNGNKKRRPETLIAIAAAVGTDMDAFCDELKAQLREYNYSSTVIRLSELISQHPNAPTIDRSTPTRTRESLMGAGTAIRHHHDCGDAVALLGIAAIEQSRSPLSEPAEGTAYVLRTLKHPDEVRRLREVYGHGLLLIGVHSTRDSRKRHLASKNVGEQDAERLMDKDEAESDKLGQRTRDVFELADAFVSVDYGPDIAQQVGRVLALLFGHPFESPTQDEHAMFLAFATGMRSADLSRQVGAIILDSRGELVGCGTNEVPKAGGGLYSCEDKNDLRDFRLGYDSNSRERELLGEKIAKALDRDYTAETRQKLKESGLFDLTEYGRAVHAEMEALLSCARVGVSVVGGVLYCTTYPCHNCAKHIIAAGIERVVFVEPYPKSRATRLHGDEIAKGRVALTPFVGIGPRKYVAFFSTRLAGTRVLERKDGKGDCIPFRKDTAEIRFPLEPSSYLDRELVACRDLHRRLDKGTE